MAEQSSFGKLLDAISAVVRVYESRPVSERLFAGDDMAHPEWDKENKHYLSAGRSALEIVLQAMVVSETTAVHTVLDMPCGFGRVTRHLTAAFPAARIYACDLYRDRIDFCAAEFGVQPIKSEEDFSRLTFPEGMDLIWCGSLLTHLPAPLFEKCLRLFSRSLNPGGIAVVTLQGRHSPFIQKHKWKYIDDASFALAEQGFRQRGFGYVDYRARAKFFEQESYGVTVSAPSYVLRCLEADETIRIQGFVERRWDDCQDVVVFKKVPINS